jgi:hypothetical protein
MSWDVDPPRSHQQSAIANDIDFRTWGDVDIIHKGAKYVYSLREGPEQLTTRDNPLSKVPEWNMNPHPDR